MDDQVMGLTWMAELNYLRLEAMDLFETCLTEGRADLLEGFIQSQIVDDQPRLELLREIAEDLYERLEALRENHLEMVRRACDFLNGEYATTFDPLQYSNPEQVISMRPTVVLEQLRQVYPALSASDEQIVLQMLKNTDRMTQRIQADIHMTEGLYSYLSDWISALTVAYAQLVWLKKDVEAQYFMIQ